MARSLLAGEDFALDEPRCVVQPIPAQALTAVHLLARVRDYILQDGAVQIVDEYTGRVMPYQRLGEGLQQLVKAKEG